MNRRRAFTLKQAKERAFLPVILAVHYHLHFSPTREVWMRERSSLWWEEMLVKLGQECIKALFHGPRP